MASVSHAKILSGGERRAKINARKDVKTSSATKLMDFAKAIARTDSLETDVTRSARVAAKAVDAIRIMANAKMVTTLAGVATNVMKLVQKALVLKDATVKQASPKHVSLAAFRSKITKTTRGVVKLAQKTAKTINVTEEDSALRDVTSDSMAQDACGIAVLIALAHVTKLLLARKMESAQSVRLASLVLNAT